MRRILRSITNNAFTGVAWLSILLMTGALVIILGPMLLKGTEAVFFDSTIEFRKMRANEDIFHLVSIDQEDLQAEIEETEKARSELYAILDQFARGLDTTWKVQRSEMILRQLKDQLENRLGQGEHNISQDRHDEIERAGKRIDRYIRKALEAEDKETARAYLDRALRYEEDPVLEGTAAQEFFPLAHEYKEIIDDPNVDLSLRSRTTSSFEPRVMDASFYLGRSGDVPRKQVKQISYAEGIRLLRAKLGELFGPRPGRPARAENMRYRYGATRMDMARKAREELLTMSVQVDTGAKLLQERQVDRSKLFDGKLDAFFEMVRDDEQFARMLAPQGEFYWQYFVDRSVPGHRFGGVGPEIVGTMLLTILAMLFAVPVGIITAAYLVEVASDNVFVKVIRMCINTLAGVPSIVFGLFGLALFVLVVQPALGIKSEPTIFAGGLTLAVMILPIVIRASEEAIRSVPQSYKEASLALGAGGLRTFLTVTLPAALPGVLTGTILSMSRAAGETAPILFTAAVAYTGGIPESIFEGGTMALSYSAYDVAVGDRTAMDTPHNQYGIIMTLIMLVLLLNIAAIVLRSRVARKLRGQ